jgi:Fe-S-cluster-containing dehydrogenase component
MHVLQEERGQRPHVKVTYTPLFCQHCDNPPCQKAAPEAVYKREDGLVIIDPEKAVGNQKLAKSCPYGVIYYNDELQLAQKCTGCAHLVDHGDLIKVPRCMDNCQTGAIVFGEVDDLDLEGTEILHPEYGTKPRVFYRGLPKRFVAGTVYDPAAKEVIIGADVSLAGEAGDFTAQTDAFGDFWLKDLPEADFTLTITAGEKRKSLLVSTKGTDVGLQDIPLD